MSTEEDELRAWRSERIRRVKRWLRPLPRRTNLRRYPLLKFFAERVRKRSYLWSFRVANVVPALYAGCILSLMPLVGFQIALACLLAVWLRANLPILFGLQWISNPLTIFPIWYGAYQIGRHFLGLFGIGTPPLRRTELRFLLDNFLSGNWGGNFERLLAGFGVTCLGALIAGTFLGALSSTAYRIAAKRTAASYALLKQKAEERKNPTARPSPEHPSDTSEKP